MRVHRMISILLLIEAKGKVKAKELAEKLETSVRTIYRDIDALCEAGIPLTTELGPNGGIQFMEGYTVGIKELTEEDIKNLYLNSMGIKSGKQSDMTMKVNTALLKLQKSLSSELQHNLYGNLNTIKRRFYVDDIPWWGEERNLYNVDILMQAVWQSNKLKITYIKPKGEITCRIIRPYGIVVNEMNWYMVAYCEQSNDLRTFKCERITECQYISEKFTLPVNFSIEEYWKSSKQLFKSECLQSETYPVVIKLDKHRSDILKSYQVYEVEETNNYLQATINLYKYDTAKEHILKIITFVEVLSPIELRSYVEEELLYMARRYQLNII